MKVRYIGETYLNEYIKTYTIIHGGIYDAYDIHKESSELYVMGVNCGYPINMFETLDGEEIRSISNDSEFLHTTLWKDEKLEEGDMFICTSTKLLTLTYGKIYTLDDYVIDMEWYIPLKESKGKRRYGRHNFKKISKAYARTMKINDLLGDDENSISDRLKHDGIPVIDFDKKIDILLHTINLAREYISYTGVKNVSIFDLIKLHNHHLIDEKDIEKFSKIDLNELLNER